jgi:vanillate O-demethylase ferredoxin subunit
LTPHVREWVLRACDGRALPYWDAGAHIEVHLSDDARGTLVRHYSLVGCLDDHPGCYRIAVKRHDRGRVSAALHAHAVAGTRLRISHPKNHFPLDHRDAHSLLIAGGIGVTPIMPMVRSLVQRRRSFEVLYVGREPGEMAYLDALRRLAGPCLQVHTTEAGMRPHFAALLSRQPAATRVYACGPQAMNGAIASAAGQLGWAENRVLSEHFTAGVRADDRAFDVELRRSGRMVHVGAGASILDALCAAGADVLWDCRRGECGLCVQQVLSADGPIDHRDRCLSDTERAAADALCICVSRLRGTRLVIDA